MPGSCSWMPYAPQGVKGFYGGGGGDDDDDDWSRNTVPCNISSKFSILILWIKVLTKYTMPDLFCLFNGL